MYENNKHKAKNFTKNFLQLSNLNRQIRVQNYVLETQERTFAERYTGLYFIAVALAFIAQCASVWSSYAKVESFIKFKIENPDILFAIVLACLLIVEVLKYFLVHTCLRDMYALRPIYPYPLIMCALCISVFSTWLSISGSTEIAKDTKQELQLTSEQANKEKELKSEIAKIRDTDTYKTVVWDGTGKTTKIITEAGKVLVQKRETELDSLRKTYQAKTQKFEAKQTNNQAAYNFVFGIFEALFLLFTIGSHYYKRQCAIEAQIQPEKNEVVGNLEELEALQRQVQELTAELQSALQQKAPNTPETPLYSELHSPLQSSEVTHSERVGKVQEADDKSSEKSEPEPPTEIDTERLFQELLNKYSNGNASYLQKYQKAVEHILKLKIQNLLTAEICKKVCTKFKFSESTFYGIWRLINNTKTE